jgi:hypothetical protein
VTGQDWLVLVLKIGTIWAGLAALLWILDYLWLSSGMAWRSWLMRTYLITAGFIVVLMLVTALSLFFRFAGNGPTWLDAAVIAMIGPVLTWRIYLQRRLFRIGHLMHPKCPHCGQELAPPHSRRWS